MCLGLQYWALREDRSLTISNSQLTKKECISFFVVYQSALEFYINAILTVQGSQAKLTIVMSRLIG